MHQLTVTYKSSDLSIGAMLANEREIEDLAQSPLVGTGYLVSNNRFRWLRFYYADRAKALDALERMREAAFEAEVEEIAR